MKSRKQDLMFTHVETWKNRSNISQSSFAKEIGLTKGVFNYWIRKYNESQDKDVSSCGFVELAPSNETKPVVIEQSPTKAEAVSKQEIEISLPGGVNIKIKI